MYLNTAQLCLVAVGSHFSSILIKIFLCHHDRIWLQLCPSSFSPTHYCRYVEYTFTCFSNAGKPQKFLSYMKSRHHIIKLLVNYQNYKTSPFLHCNGPINQVNFPISIYTKKKITSPGTNYISYMNSCFINNSVSSLNFFTCNG